jgi:hypothetical protein
MMRNVQTLLLLSALILLPSSALAQTRPFSMGFAARTDGLPVSTDAIGLLRSAGDMVVIQDDGGIPWDAACNASANGQCGASANAAAYPQDYINALTSLAGQVKSLPPGTRVFLYMNFLSGTRNTIADYRALGGTVAIGSTAWADRALAFNDARVMQAFLNHVNFLYGVFNPTYLAYGTEVNILGAAVASGQTPPQAWTNFTQAATWLHMMLKWIHPQSPVFFSIQADYYNANRPVQAAQLGQVWAATDLVAISTYPYAMTYAVASQLPADYYSSLIALSGNKPFAIAEAGWAAEPVFFPDPLPPGLPPRYYIPEDASQQYTFLVRLLNEAYVHNAVFVDWYEPQDIDALYASIPPSSPILPILRLFRDLGLWDEHNSLRPSGAEWLRNFSFPRSG